MARLNQLQTASLSNITESATSYEVVDVSSGNYEPENSFKGIYVTVAGIVNIEGVDGNSVQFDLDKGVHALGGQKILQSATTATGIRALR